MCNSIRLPDPPRSDQVDDTCVLRNLQTLVQVVNFRWTEEACKRIPNIKKLRVVFDDVLTDYEDCLCLHYLHNLCTLQKLESLKMRFPFCISRYPVDLLSKRLAFPTRLNKLCLRNCSLTREDLATIGSLQHLQVLELIHSSFLGGEWSTFNGEFPCLKFLRIDSCDVVCWASDTSAFRVLEKLVARDLWQLQEIPSEMGEISTLKLIHLHHCSESAAISALEIKKESFGNDSLKIVVDISWYCCSDSFWVRVKVDSFRPFGISKYIWEL
ncbi:probable disease resistance protein At1g58602 [Salvia miltiorrhiza]|uniref:probable disease resistance protein At1g58602 n=1 Tax=Salvia miltiorrhiza TaxID=226208 RepID=UPI0025AC326F|nr:probable disease resistance protein At1g58602 [Salvia miltiorrhiza]